MRQVPVTVSEYRMPSPVLYSSTFSSWSIAPSSSKGGRDATVAVSSGQIHMPFVSLRRISLGFLLDFLHNSQMGMVI